MNDEEKKGQGRFERDESRNNKSKERKTPFNKKGDRGAKNYRASGDHNNKKGDQIDPKRGLPSHNDWTWYAPSEQIAKDLASFPYSYLPGTGLPVPFKRYGTSGEDNASAKFYVPSIMKLKYMLTYGQTQGMPTDGINVAARSLYTFVRHVNSGSKNYEAADLTMYVFAMREIYAMFAEIKRAIGIAMCYVFENRNIPDTIIKALEIDPTDLRDNIATYRGRLNLIARRINSMAVPKYFKAFDRTVYLASNIFSDSDSMRGQFYIFNLGGFRVWSSTSSQQGTSLITYSIPNGYNATIGSTEAGTYGTIKAPFTAGSYQPLSTKFIFLEAMLNAVLQDEDAATMSGDILHAFKDSELYQLAETPETYTVVPVFDTDILQQIENSVCVCGYLYEAGRNTFNTNTFVYQFSGDNRPAKQDETFWDVTQENQLIVTNMTNFASSSSKLRIPGNLAFNSHKDQVSYTDNLEWSRLLLGASGKLVGSNGIITLYPGLEAILYYQVIMPTGAGSITLETLFTDAYQSNMPDVDQDGLFSSYSFTASITAAAMLMYAFDWHPFQYIFVGRTGGQTYPMILGDFKKGTVLSQDMVSNLHSAAVQAAFSGYDLYGSRR